MKRLSHLFRWQPTRETLIPLLSGLIVLALSWAMIPTREIPWLSIAIRDVLMIALVGIAFPLWYIRRHGGDWAAFGLIWRRWGIYLPINLILGALLFWPFSKKARCRPISV